MTPQQPTESKEDSLREHRPPGALLLVAYESY
jgi:hypothetical protein